MLKIKKSSSLSIGLISITKGFQDNFEISNPKTISRYSYKLNYLDIPIYYIKTIGKFNLGLGIAPSILIRFNYMDYQYNVNFAQPQLENLFTGALNLKQNKINRFDINGCFKVGRRLSENFELNLLYHKGFLKINDFFYKELSYNSTLFLGININISNIILNKKRENEN